MKILVTGKGGKSGSWAVRGVQLGRAIDAEVQPMAEISDCLNADIVVAVKRVNSTLLNSIRRSGRPWIWDTVDAWPQPHGNLWNREQSIAWLREELDYLRPNAVVVPTAQMQRDLESSVPSIVLHHHSWGRYVDHTPRTRFSVESVGYEGGESYLGRWRKVVQRECDRRGWRFVVNGDMTSVDVGIALRDSDGYPATMWKPNTKLSNLHALGIPALCSHELGYKEVASGLEFWIRTEQDVVDAFNALTDAHFREDIRAVSRDSMLPLNFVAATYKRWIERLRF